MPSILPDHLRPLFHGFLHEIRNPMSTILTASTLLAEPDLLEENDFANLVKVVEEETRRLNSVINEFDRYLHEPIGGTVDASGLDSCRQSRAVVLQVRAATRGQGDDP